MAVAIPLALAGIQMSQQNAQASIALDRMYLTKQGVDDRLIIPARFKFFGHLR